MSRASRPGLRQGIEWLCALLIVAAGDPVAAQDPRRRLPRAVEPQVFLRAEAVPQNPFVGQQVLYTLYLYTEADVGSIRPEGLPDFRGFWSRTLPQPGFVPEPVDDRGLYRVVLLQEALFPRRGGRFEIPPIETTMEATVRDDRVSGSRSPRVRDITRESNPVTVEVRELPPAPALFRGAVGEIALTAELAPRELEVGEAATLTVTVSGRGHLQGIPAPALPGSGRPALAGLEVFPPQQQSAEKLEGTTVAGSRTWSYVVVPERPGEWRLAPIEMPYFDPREERYRTARGPELELVAGRSRSLAQESGQTVELHPIRTAALPVVGGGGIAWLRLRPWLFGLPWALGWVLLSVRRRRGEVGRAGVREELLQALRSAAAESRPRPAAARIEEAWRDFLEARWGIPRGTPSTRWGSLLADRGVDREIAAGLVELADDLHYLRYAPKLSAAEGLRRELQDRSQKLLRGLR